MIAGVVWALGLLLVNSEKSEQTRSPANPQKLEAPSREKVISFSLKDRQGRTFSLDQFRGNLVFLNFWATWCPPCIEELPSMDALNQYFKTKNFSMIAVSVDKKWQDIDLFLEQISRPPSFLILLDAEQKLAEEFGTSKFPETYLINGEGKILKKFVGAFQWTDPKIIREIESYLKENLFKKAQ